VQVCLLSGCAGSGKTFRCIREARRALVAAPEGLPLVLLAPKQGTYQLEQQLLAAPDLAGYTRLSIRSFESLARFILGTLGVPCPPSLTEEGRLMVLRGLLADKRGNLKLFRASARLTGFAPQLSQVLEELEQTGLDPVGLEAIAARVQHSEALAAKLHDFSFLLREYLGWLEVHGLQDGDALLRCAAQALRSNASNLVRFETLWVDGFAEFNALELDLLCSLFPFCTRAVVTFCLNASSSQPASWLSHWSVVKRNLERCRKRFRELPNVEILTETLSRNSTESRFSLNPVFEHLEQYWAEPRPFQKNQQALRLVSCVDREAEVVMAAREILGFVRAGGRYRETSVFLRHFEPYHQLIQKIFSRYQIPFFLDRREMIAHHPLAELTRSAIRLVAFEWQHEDWFAALKSGFAAVDDHEIDLLENEALARGWKGQTWHEPVRLRDVPRTEPEREHLVRLEQRLEASRVSILPPFEQLNLTLASFQHRPTGPQLASALRQLWNNLKVPQRLESWVNEEHSNTIQTSPSVHETVWRQLNAWLDNAELAFPTRPLSLREWLPILEAGLANLSVGIIPPALDQVLVGAVDRSRTPEVKLAVVLGLNENVFPAPSASGSLLTESDRAELANYDVIPGSDARHQLARERYLGYIACTRAREKLVLTWAAQDPNGAPLNPSAFITRIGQLFPNLNVEAAPQSAAWMDAQHLTELIPALLSSTASDDAVGNRVGLPKEALLELPGLASLNDQLQHLHAVQGPPEALSPALAARLYGPVLRTSVSRMEQFAACPFRFFVHSGLRAEERKLFELDVREQGSFQHEALAEFHESLQAEGKRWRDVTPAEARERIGRIALSRIASFRQGLLETNDQTRFTGRVLAESLQDFVETAVAWMRQQYEFDPVQVELGFGDENGAPSWKLPLDSEKTLELRGRIDRVDLHHPVGSPNARCVILDYKSSHKQLDSVLIEHGLQLQLLSYLNVLRHWPNPKAIFGADLIEPAGVFYVNLRGKYEREANRVDALAQPEQDRRLA